MEIQRVYDKVIVKNRKNRLDFGRKHLKESAQFWKKLILTDETKISLNQNDRKRKG